jgi:hypothetical protein
MTRPERLFQALETVKILLRRLPLGFSKKWRQLGMTCRLLLQKAMLDGLTLKLTSRSFSLRINAFLSGWRINSDRTDWKLGSKLRMQSDIKEMQSEVRGLQTENRRILDRLFPEQ